MTTKPNYVYVLAPSRQVFENVCVVDWNENPRDRKFIVFSETHDYERGHGRMWLEGDQLRIVAPEMIRASMYEMMLAIMATIGAPKMVLDRLR